MYNATLLEWAATSLSLIFLYFLIKRDIKCWIFGILSSLISVFLFYEVKLYSEAILYFLYVLFGFYGWYNWKNFGYSNEKDSAVNIQFDGMKSQIKYVLLGGGASVSVGYFWASSSDASFPYADAATTSFALIATWLEARRVFENWFYWIAVNCASVFIYGLKDLKLYALLMIVYSIMSIWGWWTWKSLKPKENDAFFFN